MSRSFEISTKSPASVERVHEAFSREDYWLARHATFDASSTLDVLTVDADGTVTVCATQHLGRQSLLGVIAKLVPGDLKILHSERWTPVGERRVQGQISVSAPMALGSGRAEAWLVPAGHGSQLRFAATVEVKIPVVGGKLENSIAANLVENLYTIQRFTTTWIAGHA